MNSCRTTRQDEKKNTNSVTTIYMTRVIDTLKSKSQVIYKWKSAEQLMSVNEWNWGRTGNATSKRAQVFVSIWHEMDPCMKNLLSRTDTTALWLNCSSSGASLLCGRRRWRFGKISITRTAAANLVNSKLVAEKLVHVLETLILGFEDEEID